MKKPKPHLLVMQTSASPENCTCLGLCGEKIEKAHILGFWDEQGMNERVKTPFGVCDDCDSALYTALPRNFCYIYVVREKIEEKVLFKREEQE